MSSLSVSFFIGLCIGILLGLLKLFHKHDWICIRVMKFKDISFVEHIPSAGTTYTRVYWKCKKCSKVRTKDIKGSWEESDFKRE